MRIVLKTRVNNTSSLVRYTGWGCWVGVTIIRLCQRYPPGNKCPHLLMKVISLSLWLTICIFLQWLGRLDPFRPVIVLI